MLDADVALWEALRGARVFVTGGTGFVGKWLLESFGRANGRFGLGARMVVLSRDPDGFRARFPGLHSARGVEWWAGDVRDFALPPGTFTHAIHGATDVRADARPLETFQTIVKGTERVLQLCRERGVPSLLLVSSGAVYGRQPPELARVEEDFAGAPPTTRLDSAYGQGKRAAEWLAFAQGAECGTAVRTARCFAFVGPYLPLDRHLAVGNFIADRLAGRPIEVRGDGTAIRSYLYAADLAGWLWALLLRGAAGCAYNVGSEEAIDVGALAHRIAAMENGTAGVRIAGRPTPDVLPERYVPSTRKARTELGLQATVTLDQGISRTLEWARGRH